MSESQQDDTGATSEDAPKSSPSSAPVQGLPWWGNPSSGRPLYFEHLPGAVSAVRPAVLIHSPAAVIQQGGGTANDERQLQTAAPVVHQPTASEYSLPHTQLELAQSMAPSAYQYVDPYFGGLIAAYGAQVYPHVLGLHHSRMPLPSEVMEEEPVYVNAKQYKRIMMRRQSRAKAESENKLVKSRKPYLHESRHLHAMRRARGCGGRFLNTKGDSSKASSDSKSEEQSSQGATTPDSRISGQGFRECVSEMVGSDVYDQSVSTASYTPNVAEVDQNQSFHAVPFQLNLGIISESNLGQNGGLITPKSQQRAVAMH